MTATPPVDRAAVGRLIAALEHAWMAIRLTACLAWFLDQPAGLRR
jgi:hypothetical protein